MSVSRLAPAFFLSFSLTLVHAGPSPQASPEDLNLLKNPDFEEGNVFPAGWGRHPKETEKGTEHALATEKPFSGKACGCLTSTCPRPSGQPPIQWSQYGVEIEGDVDLWVSFRYRTDGDRPPWAGIHFYGANKRHLGFHRIPCSAASPEWNEHRTVVTVPERAESLGFVLYGHDQCSTWYDQVRLLIVPKAKLPLGTPEVDGKRSDACWGEAAKLTPFYIHPRCEETEKRAVVSVVHDDHCLSLFLECPSCSVDEQEWNEIQLSVAPVRDPGHIYCIAVERTGEFRAFRKDATPWTSKARLHVAAREDAWTAELSLPFESMDLDLNVKETWGFNALVLDQEGAPLLTWSPGGADAPNRFGKIQLSPDLSRFYAPDLRRRLKGQRRQTRTLRKELKREDVGEDCVPWRLLREADEVYEELQEVTRGADQVSPDAWDEARHKLTDARNKLEEAQALSRSWPFSPESVQGAFRVIPASSMVKIHRTGPVRARTRHTTVSLQAAKDEEESFQLVVVAGKEDVEGLTVQIREPQRGASRLPVRWHRVGYVKTAEPCYDTPLVGWWPDPLLPAAPVSVNAMERQPLWFTVTVPPGTEPGRYKGEVQIQGQDLADVRIPLEVRVWDFQLPRPGRLATPFGLYAHALSNWYYGSAPYREAMPAEQFSEWCSFMGRYRLTPKNIAREYLGKVETEGETFPDLTRLQETLQPLAEPLFSPYSFCIYRLPSNHSIDNSAWKNNLPEAEGAFFRHVQAWESLGLPNEAYVYGVDEPRPAQYSLLKKIYKRIKKRAPIYPIMQTIGDPYPQELEEWVDIWCPLTARLEGEFYSKRVAAGDALWTYVCCSPKPPYANFFVDQPATAHRVLFWQAKNAGATGLLYWCVCWWKGLPSKASGEAHFPEIPVDLSEADTYQSFKVNGDGLLLYPGPNGKPWPSLRLEVIRDGIEDYEMLALLEECNRGTSNPVEIPEEISRSWTQYTDDPALLLRRREAVAELIQDLAPHEIHCR